MGVCDPQFDATITGAQALAGDRLRIPGAKSLIEGLGRDLGIMLAPLQTTISSAFAILDRRRIDLLAKLPRAERDELAPHDIQAMGSARHDGPDSLHLLIMDSHKAINALAAQSAQEEIDGAHVHHVDPADRPGPRSGAGAGVIFSRNPATGANEPYLDFLFDAQGEDVVSGRRTPVDAARLGARLPEVARKLIDGARRIEHARRDAQDVEFTVEEGRLYFLQARSAKRTPLAALRIAVAMVHEG
jgi:hypothetical protein